MNQSYPVTPRISSVSVNISSINPAIVFATVTNTTALPTALLPKLADCNVTKGCFFPVANCDPTNSQDCVIGVTYKDAGKGLALIELFGKQNTSMPMQYVSVGFSSDNQRVLSVKVERR